MVRCGVALGCVLMVACGTRSDERPGVARTSGGAPTDGGAPAGCAQLLQDTLTPKVFVLPQDSWVSARRGLISCSQGASDGLGNLGFAVQTYGVKAGDPPGEARIYVVDPSSGAVLQATDLMGQRGVWKAFVHGFQDGFLAVNADFSRLQVHVFWLGHTGTPTGARLEPVGDFPNEVLATLPDGRVLLASDQLSGAVLEEYGGDAGLLWSTPLGTPGLAFLAVDVLGATLFEHPDADGGLALTWIDGRGAIGASFTMTGFFVDLFQRAEGGFFLQSQDANYPYVRWVGQVSSGGHTIEPAPGWLPTPPGPSGVDTSGWFQVVPGAAAYVIDRRFSPPTSSGLEFRSATGEVCGNVDLFPVDGRIRALDSFSLGLDGTLIARGLSCDSGAGFSAALQANTGVPLCVCAWQYWPKLLHSL